MEKEDSWDVCLEKPYLTSGIKPLENPPNNKDYDCQDYDQEIYALAMWRLQEQYGLDFKSAFVIADCIIRGIHDDWIVGKILGLNHHEVERIRLNSADTEIIFKIAKDVAPALPGEPVIDICYNGVPIYRGDGLFRIPLTS